MSHNHILIVEDEKEIADLLRDYLIKEGDTTTWFEDGLGVIDFVKESQPDLILLDLMLPKTDGITLCRQIRTFSDIPIIMVTARVDEIDRIIGLEIGADDYVCKPFSPKEVMARIRAVLRRRSPLKIDRKNHRVIQSDLIQINTLTRQVSIGSEQIKLTPSEYELILILISHPGQVFSRSQLMDNVQGYSFEGYERSIDFHIKNLRKKIHSVVPGANPIQSIYGIGFKYEDDPDPL